MTGPVEGRFAKTPATISGTSRYHLRFTASLCEQRRNKTASALIPNPSQDQELNESAG